MGKGQVSTERDGLRPKTRQRGRVRGQGEAENRRSDCTTVWGYGAAGIKGRCHGAGWVTREPTKCVLLLYAPWMAAALVHANRYPLLPFSFVVPFLCMHPFPCAVLGSTPPPLPPFSPQGEPSGGKPMAACQCGACSTRDRCVRIRAPHPPRHYTMPCSVNHG